MNAAIHLMRASLIGLISIAGLSACATVNKSEFQTVDVKVMFDHLRDREPTVCVVENNGRKITGNAPLLDLTVDRSAQPLLVQCRTASGRTAKATVVSRVRTSNGSLLAGTAGMVIDHLSGKLYDYPRSIELVLGRNRTFDADSLAGLPVQDQPIPGLITPATLVAKETPLVTAIAVP